jgi:oligopeptide/dipeptide ABC transporter ATP-binding protein
MGMSEKLLRVKGLKTYFYTQEGVLPAVDGLDFDLEAGETLAVVGESGCGKSVTAFSILRLIPEPPGKIIGGQILYEGKDLLKYSKAEMHTVRGNSISMIFQEPMTSLNPVFTVGSQISGPLTAHQGMTKQQARARAVEMLGLVGLPNPAKCVDHYPHQLSGGMRQRVMTAMALACNPKILIADEPTTALDVTIQAQILRLLMDIKQRLGTAIILITHDLGIVAQTAERVMVMYAGEAVEYAGVKQLYEQPGHPYTVGLLESIPKLREERERLYNIKGTIPSPDQYPGGCRFSPRCQSVMEKCERAKPGLFDAGAGRRVRCWRFEGGTDCV